MSRFDGVWHAKWDDPHRTPPKVPLAIKAVCPDCGHVMRYVDELDSHDLHCLGPIRLRFIDEGDPIAEVGSE